METQPDSCILLLSVPIDHPTGLPDPFRPGASCPNCKKGKLDYNGLLELECPACGIRFGSGTGCT